MVTRVAGLEPLPPSWPVWALSLAAGGVSCYAGAPLMHLDSFSLPGGVALEAAALLSAITGVRAQRRGWLTDQLTEALTPLLGLREPSREHVKVSRWRGHWIGAPERLRLSYNRGSVNTDHPRWNQDVLATVQRLLGAEYTIRQHDVRRGVLKLRRILESPETTAAKTPAVERATRIAREMLGATATLVPTFADELDEDDQLQLCAVTVKHQAGTRIERPAQRARIERTFSAMLPGRWRALWQLEDDTVRFEIRPTLLTRFEHPAPPKRDGLDVLRDYDKVAIELAVDEDAHMSTWQPAIDPHLMVVGATGTGKTVLLHGVLTEITSWGWPVFVNDAKGVEFLGFREWPNVRAVATSIGEQVAVIHTVWQIMEDRYNAVIEGRAHESDFEPVVLFLDEFRDFYGNLTDWYARVRVTGKGGDPTKAPVIEKVKSIARKGRTARVHLVLGTQRPDADFLSGEMRDNFRARVSLGRLSPQGSMMMWDSPSAAVSVPKGIRGRGITLDHNDRPREIQTFWTPDPRKVRAEHTGDLAILRSLLPAQSRHERLVIIAPHVDETSDLDEPRYGQWAGAFLQTSSTGGLASTDHLRHVARIVPLSLHPDRAPRSTLAPALLFSDSQGAEHDELVTAAVGSTQDGDGFDGEGAVIVEKVPEGSRFVSLESRTPADHIGNGPTDDAPETSYAAEAAFSYADERDAEQDEDDELDPFAGYGNPEDLTVDELEAGMLVLLDEDTDHWAVLEEDPAPDLDDDDARCLDWRDDHDNAGSLTVDASAMVTARHPLDEAVAEDEHENITPNEPRRPSGSTVPRSSGSTPRRRGSRAAVAAPERPQLHVVR